MIYKLLLKEMDRKSWIKNQIFAYSWAEKYCNYAKNSYRWDPPGERLLFNLDQKQSNFLEIFSKILENNSAELLGVCADFSPEAHFCSFLRFHVLNFRKPTC